MMEDRGPQVQEDSPAQDQPRAQPDHAAANGSGGAPAVAGAVDGAPAEQSLMQQRGAPTNSDPARWKRVFREYLPQVMFGAVRLNAAPLPSGKVGWRLPEFRLGWHREITADLLSP